MAKADQALIDKLSAVAIKENARKTNIDRNTIRKMLRDLPVRTATIQRIVVALTE